jgi:hypothetical protein
MQQTICTHQIPFFSKAVSFHKTNLVAQLIHSITTFSKKHPGPTNHLNQLNWPFITNWPKAAAKNTHKFNLLENLFTSGHKLKGRPLIIIMRPMDSLTCC